MMKNNYDGPECERPVDIKPVLTERLEIIYSELIECENIAENIEIKLYGPRPCDECGVIPCDMSIETQINQIGSTVARIKRLLLDIKNPL